MAGLPPYMNATGLPAKIFEKIADAQKPERFTQDFLGTVLGFSSGSAKAFIPLLKRLGFINSDGTPTQLYSRFRNPDERASAMLDALKTGYPTLYARREFAHALSKEKLRDLVVEVTGLDREDANVRAIVGTFDALRTAGNVDTTTLQGPASTTAPPAASAALPAPSVAERHEMRQTRATAQEVGMNLSYTINLNLPPSPNPEVFNAIFKALKEHLLSK